MSAEPWQIWEALYREDLVSESWAQIHHTDQEWFESLFPTSEGPEPPKKGTAQSDGAGGGEPSDRERLLTLILNARDCADAADAILEAGFANMSMTPWYEVHGAGRLEERERIRREVEETLSVWHSDTHGEAIRKEYVLAIIDAKEQKT